MVKNTRKVPLIDLKSQYHDIEKELNEAVLSALKSGQYIMGPQVEEFERLVAQFCGVQHAVALANGTDALVLTLDALGVGPGDEVITTPFTFFASAESISRLGATPVFVDICEDSYNLDVSKLEQAITAKTKAIIPVHLFGLPADMDEIMEIANIHGIPVIEDACQAMGSHYKGESAGSIGTAGCFSFFPTKNLGGFGDGGMVVTNDEELAKQIKILRVHGGAVKYHHTVIGYNSRLDTLQAAMLKVKLPHLDKWNERRMDRANIYHNRLSHLPIKLPSKSPHRTHIYHLYIIQTDKRDELINYLSQHGISSGVYYPVPLHRQEVYKHLGYQEDSLPVAEKASKHTLAIPLYPEMTDDDQDYVISVIETFYKGG